MNLWMFKKALREFYLLPRGEQRAMLLLSLLLIFSLAIRVTVQMLPPREPPGMEQFMMESREIMLQLARDDSLKQISQKDQTRPGSLASHSPYRPLPASQKPGRSPVSLLNINNVDSAGLLPLPGIGPVFAGRIIRYRNLLGGFWSTDQLSEVYGLSRETIKLIMPVIYIDTTDIEMLKINSAGFRDLLRHPYLEYEDVRALMKYRDMEGSVRSFHEIMENNLLADTTLERILPYLDFGH